MKSKINLGKIELNVNTVGTSNDMQSDALKALPAYQYIAVLYKEWRRPNEWE